MFDHPQDAPHMEGPHITEFSLEKSAWDNQVARKNQNQC